MKHVGGWLQSGASAAASGAAEIARQASGAVSAATDRIGSLMNQTKVQSNPEQNYLDVNLALKDVDLRKTAEQLGLQLPFPISGRMTLQIQMGMPVDTPKDLKTYRGRGTVDLPTLSIAGLDLTNVHAAVRLDKGVLRLDELKATVQDAALTGYAELTVDGDYPFQGKADVTRFNLDTLQHLSPGVRLPVTVQGNLTVSANVRGELRTQKFTASGNLKAADLVVEKARIDTVSCKWEATPTNVRLRDLQTKLYDGEVTGDATLPLRDTSEGSVDLRIREMDTVALTRALPSMPVKLEGRVSGTVNVSVPAAAAEKPRELSARIDLQAPMLRLQNIPAQRVRGSVSYRAGKGEYRLEGETLGGTFKLEGRLPPTEGEKDSGKPADKEMGRRLSPDASPALLVSLPPVEPPEKPDGQLTIEGVRLNLLGPRWDAWTRSVRWAAGCR